MKGVQKYEVVAAAAVKKFKKMILDYKGPPEKLRAHLLKELDRKVAKADALLTEILDDVLM